MEWLTCFHKLVRVHASVNFVISIPCCLFVKLDEAKEMSIDSSLWWDLVYQA